MKDYEKEYAKAFLDFVAWLEDPDKHEINHEYMILFTRVVKIAHENQMSSSHRKELELTALRERNEKKRTPTPFKANKKNL